MTDDEMLEKLLPLICKWVEEQEQMVLKHGVELTEDQKNDAYLVGVKEIDKVRLLKVNGAMPFPSDPILQQAAKLAGLMSRSTLGVTFRYGICIKDRYWNNRSLVVHELVHTMQYERLGGLEPFIYQYLDECIRLGYPHGPLEQEAMQREKQIVQ